MTQPTPMSMYGAVDLGALSAARDAQAKSQQAAAAAPAGVIKDVTTATFQAEVLEQSLTVPVVIDLWADWCGPCKQLTPVLERLAAEYAGRWVLAKVDVDAEQQIGAAFQVQSIPSVFAVIGGQPLPLFQGALPEAQVRQYLEALLAEAAKHGVTGTVGGAAPAPEAPEPDVAASHPGLDAAYDAIEAGDWEGARAAYQSVLDAEPGNDDAAVGLRLVALYERADGADPAAALSAAAAAPDDVAAQLLAADLEALAGSWQAAFDRLIGLVKRTAGADRANVRTRVVELFDLAGPEEPAVAKARVALANALF
jgi:putative thioredoxin